MTRRSRWRCYLAAWVFVVWVVVVAPSAFAVWTIQPIYTGQDAGPLLAIDVDATGRPQTAFQVLNDMQYSIRTGPGWTPQGQLAWGQTFALSNTDAPFFTTRPVPNFELKLFNGLTAPFSGNGTVAPGRVASTMWLGFDSLNRPHIGYLDTTSQLLKHAGWNGTSWDIQTVAADPTFQFVNNEFAAAIDANDRVHFAWDPLAAGPMQYARPTGAGSWSVGSIPNTSDGVVNDMQIDSQGNVHLAFDLKTGSALTGGLHYGVYNGTSWTTERITGLDSAVRAKAQLVLDNQGKPNFLTFDADAAAGVKQLKHVYRAGATWKADLITSWNGADFGPIAATTDAQGIHATFVNNLHNVSYASFKFPLPGDYDGNGSVGPEDYNRWRSTFGSTTSLSADGNGNGIVDAADYVLWRKHRTSGSGSVGEFAAASVPEPSLVVSVLPCLYIVLAHRRREIVRQKSALS